MEKIAKADLDFFGMMEYPKGTTTNFLEGPQAAYKACLNFLYGMIDDSEIIKYQYIIYGLEKTYQKLKSSFNSYVMFKIYCSNEKFNKYQMWSNNVEFYLKEFEHSVNNTDSID